MKIAIDIDDDLYTRLFDNGEIDAVDMLKACAAIRKGTPLPKGHGRLIDCDYLYKKFVANKCSDSLVLQFIKDEPTIIEADKESEMTEKKLSWLGKNCKDCGNKKCKDLGVLPKGYDCALWQAESEDKE